MNKTDTQLLAWRVGETGSCDISSYFFATRKQANAEKWVFIKDFASCCGELPEDVASAVYLRREKEFDKYAEIYGRTHCGYEISNDLIERMAEDGYVLIYWDDDYDNLRKYYRDTGECCGDNERFCFEFTNKSV